MEVFLWHSQISADGQLPEQPADHLTSLQLVVLLISLQLADHLTNPPLAVLLTSRRHAVLLISLRHAAVRTSLPLAELPTSKKRHRKRERSVTGRLRASR